MASIGRYYDELASSCPIPQSYLCKYSLAQLGESIALALWCASRSGPDQRKVERERGVQASQGSQDGQDSRGDQGGRGRGRGRGGRGGQGGRESQSRRWRTPLCPEGRHFRDIIPTIISVDTFITPKKSQHQQFVVRLKNFFLDPIVVDLQSKAYNPYEEISLNDENKTRLLFHGTRESYLSEFKCNGVAGKVQWRPNELCPDRAFYTTNSVEQAVADVLYGCPQPTHLDIVDPIVILVFAVDVMVLHGDRPLPNKGITLSTYWYEHDDLEHCQEFTEVCVIV